MSAARRRLAFGALILFVSLSVCQQGLAEGDPTSIPSTIHPAVVTGVRWLADPTAVEEDPSCHCSEPNAIARGLPQDLSAEDLVVCLGARGFLIAQMSATFTNGPGADLLIYEWGSQRGGTDDRFTVYVSENGRQWIPVAEAVRNDLARPYASIDLGDKGDDYLYVKIIPATNARLGTRDRPEILAIEALHPSVQFEF